MRKHNVQRLLSVFLLLAFSASGFAARKHPYLAVWAGDDDKKASDFLAIIGADPASPSYGKVVASKPVGESASMPHHTEDVVAGNHHLLANGFDAGRTWLFDLSRPTAPRIITSFGDMNGYNHPHTYVRLPDGDVLATFQYHGKMQTGGLVEFTERGKFIRAGSAVNPQSPTTNIQPYSVLALPKLDRAISTDTSMMEFQHHAGEKIQIWRLSDLKLLQTIVLPPGPRGDENHWTGEARQLADGSVYVHTFKCALYHVTGVQSGAPKAAFVYEFPGEDCAVPISIDHWWMQTVPAEHAVVVLETSDPDHPKEISRVTLDSKQKPHWISLEPGGKRIVINSGEYGEHRVFIANFDRKTGRLTLDEKFRDPGSDITGVSMDGKTWPHGFRGNAYPHGAVFAGE